MTLIYSTADQVNREFSDDVAAKDIVRPDDAHPGRDMVVVPKGQRIPKGFHVEDDEVEGRKKKAAGKAVSGPAENKAATGPSRK